MSLSLSSFLIMILSASIGGFFAGYYIPFPWNFIASAFWGIACGIVAISMDSE